MKNISTLQLASETMTVVSSKKPSSLIPFIGDFPLLKPWQESMFQEDIANHPHVSELKEWVADILWKAKRLKEIEDGFIEYLDFNKIRNKFNSMDSKDKTKELLRFFDANCLTIESLNI